MKKEAASPKGGKFTRNRSTAPFPIVGVGASAGGLEAFTELLTKLPLDTGLGFVLVQHLDPQHESALTQLLARATAMPVSEVTNHLRVQANHIYVIPPNTNLSIARGILKLQPRAPGRTPTRSIDFFFESLAQDQRQRAIGVVLSGTATDGTVGLEAIKAEGGITFAQDDSAKYDSMPRSAAAAGCVDFVLKPEDIAKQLARIAGHPYVVGQSSHPERDADQREPTKAALASGGRGTPRTGAAQARKEAAAAPDKAEDDPLKKVLVQLRKHSGVDFSLYKSSTIQRRIARRMLLNKQSTPEDYAELLRGNSKELDALYSDVLISVTSFFRNPDSFDFLKHKVFPKLLQQRNAEPCRVWTLGCSTGQEAYSIAMAFTEAADGVPRVRKLQVFATDLNEALLEKARHGLYAKSLAQDISPERLRRFFVEEEGGYRVVKSLREMVVFARQNLISDPPFSRMDLISCRNLMIYLESGLQQKLLPLFHYALKPEGFLFLGASESIGSFADLFHAADKKHKIFSRKAAPVPPLRLPMKDGHSPGLRPPFPAGKAPAPSPDGLPGELNAQREADRVMVNQFAPPSVLINADLQILQFRGPTSAYLEPPTGKASFDVLKMAREGLMLPLRAAINKAKKENKTALRENVLLRQNGHTRKVTLQVIPLKNLRERCFLILFLESDPAQPAGSRVSKPSQRSADPGDHDASGSAPRSLSRQRVIRLEAELAETRDFLQSVQEQNEAAHEELQASNEEVQSANEELQSINEELETSKEELESANEELTTINDEMADRNQELNRLNSDLSNLQSSTRLPILLLGRDLTIRRFSAAAEKQFNLLSTDVGRSIRGIRHNLVVSGKSHQEDAQSQQPTARNLRSPKSPGLSAFTAAPAPLEDLVREVIDTVRERELEVRDEEGRWFSLRVRPYLTTDNKVDGAVLVLLDISELKHRSQEAEAARDYAEAILNTARHPMVVLDPGLRVVTANDAFYKTFKVTPAGTEGLLIYDLGNRQWQIPKLITLLEDILPRNGFFNDLEVTHDFPRIGPRSMLLSARRLDQPEGVPQKILIVIEDVTERQRLHTARQAAEASERAKDDFLAVLSHELRTPLTPILLTLGMLSDHKDLPPVFIKAFETMERNVKDEVRLIDDLLDLTRIGRGKMELARMAVDLHEVVEHAAQVTRPMIEAKQQTLTVRVEGDNTPLSGDEARLKQVFWNLLINASKFTPKGGTICLTARHENGQSVVSVRDTGIGFEGDAAERLFAPFVQGSQKITRQFGGLGLGLAICKAIVESHGGSIHAESPGASQGATFTVKLPLGNDPTISPPS